MKSVWGIDLGYSAVKAVKMVRSGSALVVQAYDIIPLTGGTGDMSREDILRGAMGALASRQRLRSDGVYVAIPGKGVLTKFISLPPVEEKRIPEIVNYEARQQIPFDLSEVIWRYQQVKEKFAPGEPVEISLVAVRKDAVEEMISTIGDLRNRLAGIQISPLALYNYVKYDQPLKGATVMIDIGAEVTDLVVASRNGFWPRGLHIAGNTVNRALEEKFKVSFEEAESIKQAINESKFRKQILDVLQPIFRELIGEIQRSLGYYKSLAKDIRIEEILILGNGLRLSGLDRFLAENLQYNVRKLTELHRIQLGRNIDPREFSQALPGLAVALGLGVQALGMGEVKLNCLPDEFLVAREVRKKKPVAVAALLAAVAGLGLLHVRATRTRDLIEKVMAKDTSQAIIEKAQKLEKEWKAEQEKVSYEKLNFLTGIPSRIGFPEKGEGEQAPTAQTPGANRDFWLNAISQIRDTIPEHVYLRSLQTRLADPESLRAAEQKGSGQPDTGAPEAAGAPTGGGSAGSDATKKRIVITLTVETESHRGLDYIRENLIKKLQKLKWKPHKSPAFKSVEEIKSGIVQESRDGTGQPTKGGSGHGMPEAPSGPPRGGDTEATIKQNILRQTETTYLVVPIRCVAKTEGDFAAEQEQASAGSPQ